MYTTAALIINSISGGIIGTIWARILACNRPLIAAGITLILAAVILRRIPRLSKEDWIINTRRTVTGLGILLIVLSFTAGDGSGFGIGSGDGIGIGDENSSGAQNVQEDPDPDGAKKGNLLSGAAVYGRRAGKSCKDGIQGRYGDTCTG